MHNFHKKLVELRNKPLELRKSFKFSMEKLQDEPKECLREVEQYLSQHSDKIEDYYLETYVDEETFAPVMVMHVIPNARWRSFMSRDGVWDYLLPETMRLADLESKVRKVMEWYRFQPNTVATRKRIAADLEKVLNVNCTNPRVVDITSTENVNNGTSEFNVQEGDKEYSIEDYLRHLQQRQ